MSALRARHVPRVLRRSVRREVRCRGFRVPRSGRDATYAMPR